MEAGKLQQEAEELRGRIGGLQALLGSPDAVRETVAREAREIVDKHGNPRRTAVLLQPPSPHTTPSDTVPLLGGAGALAKDALAHGMNLV